MVTSDRKWRVFLTEQAQRDARKQETHSAAIRSAVALLEVYGPVPPIGQAKRLRGRGEYSIRARREVRILYTVDPQERTIVVRRIGHRKDIYE